MIRMSRSRRSLVGLLAAAALIAAACEPEEPEALAPLQGDVPSDRSAEADPTTTTETPPPTEAGGESGGGTGGGDDHRDHADASGSNASGGASSDGADSEDGAQEEGEATEYPDVSIPATGKNRSSGGSGDAKGASSSGGSSSGSDDGSDSGSNGGSDDEYGDGGSEGGSGGSDAGTDHSGMPHVNTSAIPSGSSGTGSALLGTTSSAPATDDIQGALVMFCQFSHMNFDDAIVFPGVQNATHLHAYFGNTGARFDSTPSSIRNSGNSTCLGGTANRSSYWVPALIDTRDRTPVRPHEMVTYYTHGRVPGPEIEPHPAGLRILAGSAMSSSSQTHVRWWCPGDRGHYESYISPNCNPNEELKLSVTFPQCWNGRDTHSSDQSHMAYPGWNTGCPDSHPIAVPQVNLNVIWHLDGHPTTDLRMSSDMYSQDRPGGYSGHADWFDGWDRDILETWVSECVNEELYCFGGNLGNGQALQRP